MKNEKREKVEISYDYKTMGKRIVKRRKASNLTQAQLAEKIPLSTVHMSNIENGKEHLSFPVFIKICQILDINPDYLILGNIRSNNAGHEIYKNLSAISNSRDIEAIKVLVEFFLERSPDLK